MAAKKYSNSPTTSHLLHRVKKLETKITSLEEEMDFFLSKFARFLETKK